MYHKAIMIGVMLLVMGCQTTNEASNYTGEWKEKRTMEDNLVEICFGAIIGEDLHKEWKEKLHLTDEECAEIRQNYRIRKGYVPK